MVGELSWSVLQSNTLAKEALYTTGNLPTTEEIDTEPNLEEVNKAIDSFSNVNTPGSDAIPSEIRMHNLFKQTGLHERCFCGSRMRKECIIYTF